MKNRLYCKIIAVGIIVLFMGVSVSSGFVIDNKSTVIDNLYEENCDCNEIIISNPMINKYLERIKFYINFILLRYRHYPEVYKKCNMISSDFDTLILDSETTCDFLWGIYEIISSISRR